MQRVSRADLLCASDDKVDNETPKGFIIPASKKLPAASDY